MERVRSWAARSGVNGVKHGWPPAYRTGGTHILPNPLQRSGIRNSILQPSRPLGTIPPALENVVGSPVPFESGTELSSRCIMEEYVSYFVIFAACAIFYTLVEIGLRRQVRRGLNGIQKERS